MQKVINKVYIDNDIYYKVINIINDNVVNINIYKKIDDNFREILKREVSDDISNVLMTNNNNLPLSNEELEDFKVKLENLIIKNRQSINKQIVEKLNLKGSVKSINNFAGFTYALLSFIDKPYLEIVNITLDENGNVRSISPVNILLIDLIIADISTKLKLKDEPLYIQITHTIFYGIKKENNIIVISELYIGDEDIQCHKSFALNAKNKNYRLYRYDEMTKPLEDEIKRINTFIVEGLMKVILLELLKS